MSTSIIVLVEHLKENISEISYEMLGIARKLVDGSGGKVYALIAGRGAKEMAANLGAADVALVLDDQSTPRFTDEVIIETLKRAITEKQASLVFIGCTNFSFGIGARLSLRMGMPFVNWAKDIKPIDGSYLVTSAICA